MQGLTLTYQAAEQLVAGWGITSTELVFRSRAPSTATCRFGGTDPAAAPAIPFKGQVTLKWNGTVIFVGRRTDLNNVAEPNAAAITMVFSDPLWDLQQIIFQHFWKVGNPPVNIYQSRVFLFQDISAGPNVPWAILTADKQILEIIQYAATKGANIQPGIIDPAIQFPTYLLKAASCWEAFDLCLRSVPDTVTYFDYTQNPPKLHVRQAANLAALTLPYNGTDGAGRTHLTSALKDLSNARPPQVVIQYQSSESVTVNGQTTEFATSSTDAYPPAYAGDGLGVQVIPIDLRGGSRNFVEGQITSQAIDPTNLAFWKKYKPALALADISGLAIEDTTINGGLIPHPQGITIVDNNGNAVNLAQFPNAVIGNGIAAPWMTLGNGTPVKTIEVTITGYLAYTKSVDAAQNPAAPAFFPLEKNIHPVPVNLKLTNSPVGLQPYIALQAVDPGDPQPFGLAQYLYTAFQRYLLAGTHTIADPNLAAFITPKNVLNLSGGNAAWLAMNAVITETAYLFTPGRANICTVTFGPHKHLGASELVDFLEMWSFRRVLENPNIRNTGIDSSQTGSQIGTDAAKENTTPSEPRQSLVSAFSFIPGDPGGRSIGIQHDTTQNGGQIVAGTLKADGSDDTSQPSIQIRLSDVNETVGGQGIIFKLRRKSYSNAACQPVHCWGLFSDEIPGA